SAPPMTPWALAKAAASSLMLSEVCMLDFSERGNAGHFRPVGLAFLVLIGEGAQLVLGGPIGGDVLALLGAVHRVTASVELRAHLSLGGGRMMLRRCSQRLAITAHSHTKATVPKHQYAQISDQEAVSHQCTKAFIVPPRRGLARSRADRKRRRRSHSPGCPGPVRESRLSGRSRSR